MSIVVIDYGSQYTQLIARRVRELHVHSTIVPYHTSAKAIREQTPAGLILSGGPASCYEERAPQLDPALLELGIPVLGICYGQQLLARQFGGKITPGDQREYGRALLEITDATCPLWNGLSTTEPLTVWMSHGDRIEEAPRDFRVVGRSGASTAAAFWNAERRLFGIQFHPEVVHTPQGAQILANFVAQVCNCSPSWTMASFIESEVERIRRRVGSGGRAVCGLSGGVDSAVAAALVHRAVGERQTCILVDNGLLRRGEAAQVESVFREQVQVAVKVVRAEKRFLTRLTGIVNPEEKRRAIGREFIEVFDEEADKLRPPAQFLVQGTLYPDVIESVSAKGGPSVTIKTHHNVGGLPDRMKLELIEPLRELFKDEVRRLGEELGLPHHLLWRQPFPGPGLAVRVLGEVTPDRLDLLRRADAIIEDEIREAGLYESIWQAFGVLLPVQSVGVMGDKRTYESVLALRAVHSTDGMTADWVELPYRVLATLSNRIINEVHGINRVVYDISSKPPATIEWE